MKEIMPISNTTFETVLACGDKVEIGDKESIDFKPHIKLNRWDGECFIKVGLPTTEKAAPVVEGGKVKFIGIDNEAYFYPSVIDRFEAFRGLDYKGLESKASYDVRWESEPYNRLFVDGVLWGADDPVRIAEYNKAAKTAYGDVLMAGLGTGAFNELLLDNPSITSLTVVEISQEVIDILQVKKPYLFSKPNHYIIHDDIFHFVETTKQKFDWIGGDVWDTVCFSPAYINGWFRFKSKAEKLLKTGGMVHKGCFAEYAESAHSTPTDEIDSFEFNIILKKKPLSNKIVLNIETQGLKFYYQPALTDEEIRRGFCRPDNVVGSYAVYHQTQDKLLKTKAEGEKYKTGKAFHIFRPKIVDSEGNWVWGELSIDIKAGTLTVTIPQVFLDTAVYPIYHAAGLNFGYATEGTAGNTSLGDRMAGSVFTTPAGSSIDMDDIRAHCSFGGTSDYYRYAIYKHSDGSQVANSLTADTQVDAGADKWWPLSYNPKPTLTAETDYVLVIGADNPKSVHHIHYDNGDTDQGHYETITYPTFPATANFSHNNYKHSIYCTYEVAGVDLPTVTTQAATNVKSTTATGNGNITDTGGENCDHRGIVYGKTSRGDPGNTAYDATDYDSYEDESGDFGTGAFTRSLTSLDAGTKYYARAYAHNSEGYAYGDEIDFTTEVEEEGGAQYIRMSPLGMMVIRG